MRRLYINKLLGRNNVIKALTLSDFSMWSSSSITAVIFTLFVIEQIEGATIFDAGISSMLFITVSAFMNIPLGRLMDKIKGYVDETYILAGSSFVRGIALMALAFSTQMWQLMVLQVIMGIARSMNVTAWRVVFSKFLDTKNIAEQWSMYDTVIAVGLGLSTLIAGYLGDTIPFSYIIFISGVTALIGGIFPLFAIDDVKEIQKERLIAK